MHKRIMTRASLLLGAVIGLACSEGFTEGDLTGLQALTIAPEDLTLEFSYGTPATQVYKVEGTFSGGKRDVTAQVELKLEDALLGHFTGATLETSDTIGGRTRVTAQAKNLSAQTSLTTRVKLTTSSDGTPKNAAELFARATDSSGPAPALAYPPDGVLVPPNLSELLVQWKDSASDLWELQLSSPTCELRVYTARPQHLLGVTEWQAVAFSNRESEAKILVRGLKQAAPSQVGQSAASSIAFAAQNVEGGLYYWAASQPGGVVRHDFGRPNQKPELFYSNDQAPKDTTGNPSWGPCVACHAISPDGARMAVTFYGGDGLAGILDVKSRKLTADRTFSSNFHVYTPDSQRLITTSKGVLTLRDGITGVEQATLDTAGLASMPDLSPDGKQLVFVRRPSLELDWTFTGGSIVTAPFDGVALGAKTVVVPVTTGINVYYPAYSPDGAWIVFNGSTGDSYSDDDATMAVVRATGGAPVLLARANLGTTLRNSWVRWSPFIQTYKGKPLLWLTFSSTRDYGTTLVNSTRESKDRIPQIWMAAFDPAQAAAGQDPSFPAFWLPFQDLATNNHIAQWTKKIVTIE